MLLLRRQMRKKEPLIRSAVAAHLQASLLYTVVVVVAMAEKEKSARHKHPRTESESRDK